jgi:hypothetical protein
LFFVIVLIDGFNDPAFYAPGNQPCVVDYSYEVIQSNINANDTVFIKPESNGFFLIDEFQNVMITTWYKSDLMERSGDPSLDGR